MRSTNPRDMGFLAVQWGSGGYTGIASTFIRSVRSASDERNCCSAGQRIVEVFQNSCAVCIVIATGGNRAFVDVLLFHYHINASRMLVCVLDDFLCITIDFLGFSGYLFAETFDLLLFVADQFSSLFLHFTSDVFYNPFDLIFVHYHIPSSKLTGSPCGRHKIERNHSAGLYGNEPIKTADSKLKCNV